MASPNASPITGRERVRILQGGWDTWIDRVQFTTLLATPSLPNVGPRPYTSPTSLLGTETISGWQDGSKITMDGGDVVTFLAGSGEAPPHPDPNIVTSFTGNELIMGDQSGWKVAWTIAEVNTIRGGSGPTPPVGYQFVTTGGGAYNVTTNGGADRITVKVS